MLHLIHDRLHIPKTSKKYNSITVTKFLTPDISIPKFIDDICEPLSRQYEIKIDLGLMVIKTENGELVRRYCWPQRSTHINEITKIFTPEDKKELHTHLTSLTHIDFLNLSFMTKNNFCLFEKSDFRPHRLLTLTLYITK